MGIWKENYASVSLDVTEGPIRRAPTTSSLCANVRHVCIVDGPESRVVFLSFHVTSLHSILNLYPDTGGLTGGGIGPERSWVMVGVFKLASATCYLWDALYKLYLTLTTNLGRGQCLLRLGDEGAENQDSHFPCSGSRSQFRIETQASQNPEPVFFLSLCL